MIASSQIYKFYKYFFSNHTDILFTTCSNTTTSECNLKVAYQQCCDNNIIQCLTKRIFNFWYYGIELITIRIGLISVKSTHYFGSCRVNGETTLSMEVPSPKVKSVVNVAMSFAEKRWIRQLATPLIFMNTE